MAELEQYINIVPKIKIKKEVVENDDPIRCRLCSKGFASQVAINNHARMEHLDAYASGDPAVWTKHEDLKKAPDQLKLKTDQLVADMTSNCVVALASNDVSYIIVKDESQLQAQLKKKKVVKLLKKEREDKVVKVVPKREKETEAITGPFECLQPSTLVADGTCHQIFFSCCEYSQHHRDEHTRRRKGLRCQVCEKPLACTGGEDANFACEVCGNGYQSSAELSEHVTTAHVKHKPFECSVCHKRFTQQGGVLQHMRMHTGDRPFPCTFCPKAFTQKSGLDQHLRIHTKVKPYRCVVCHKSFCQSVHLKQHMRTHTNVQPFQCAVCHKRFKQSSHLNYHLKNHNQNANITEEQKAKFIQLIGTMEDQPQQIQIETEVDPSWCVESEISHEGQMDETGDEIVTGI